MIHTTQTWTTYVNKEIEALKPELEAKDVTLELEQPHISGERFLMSGNKVVLVGRDKKTNKRLIIKSSAEKDGIEEIEAERLARITLQKLPFAYHPLLAPTEMWHRQNGSRVIVVTEFIEQNQPYLSLPIIDQFDLIIQSFNMLAGMHATTASHMKSIGTVVKTWGVADYEKQFGKFNISLNGLGLNNTLERSVETIAANRDDIDRYCGFLTHDDFALHNFRFNENKIYLIDQSSLKFGNKHESWARFMNYMLLYNRDLEQALFKYLCDNAAPEELRSLRLMRIYKLVELLNYHNLAAKNSEGSVKKLSERRIVFWHQVLRYILDEVKTPESIIIDYRADRDALRSREEVSRQRALQQLL
jgi:hypothetical protein